MEMALYNDMVTLRKQARMNELLKGKRILVVEDDLPSQTLISVVLQDLGCVVQVTGNGWEAMPFLRQETYDAVLMDIHLPGMSGYEITDAIRHNISKTLPIIALTAHVLVEVEEKCLQSGMNDYLTKPLQVQLLTETLIKWTSNKKESR